MRLGVTGLAAIFLLVLVAAAGMRPAATGTAEATGEPLAVLGVAPGAGLAAPMRNSPPARTVAPPSRT